MRLDKKKIKRKSNLKRCVLEQGKCMNCFHTENLSAHHIIFRSEGGDDSMGNLITLCPLCHKFADEGLYYGNRYIDAKRFMIDLLKNINLAIYREVLNELENSYKGPKT